MFRTLLGHQVNTVSFGAGSPAIVGITGLIGTWEVWQQPFELLSSRHRVVGYDHFGVGLTRCEPEQVSFENQVQLAVAVMDSYGIEQWVLMGDSAMVAVAIEVARRHPERVSRLVLVCGGPKVDDRPERQRFAKGLEVAFEPTIDGFATRCLPEGDEPAREWMKAILRRNGSERLLAQLRSFARVDVTDALPLITVPTLIVSGELDDIEGGDSAELMAEAIPDASLVRLRDIGHVPQLSQPLLLVETIEEFLAGAGAAERESAVVN